MQIKINTGFSYPSKCSAGGWVRASEEVWKQGSEGPSDSGQSDLEAL